MATCPTSASSTTAVTTTSETTIMPPVQSMPTLHENSKLVDGKGTSTHAGESQESPPSKQTQTQCSLPTKLKTDGASESSIISSTNPGMASTLPDNEGEVMKRKHEHDSCNVRTNKKRGTLPIPTAIHMKLRAAGDAGDKWWHDLERKNCLKEEEALVVYGIVTKNLHKEEFPLVCEGLKKDYFLLAKEGWRLMKEYNALLKLHPKENAEQICRDGVWTMVHASR